MAIFGRSLEPIVSLGVVDGNLLRVGALDLKSTENEPSVISLRRLIGDDGLELGLSELIKLVPQLGLG